MSWRVGGLTKVLRDACSTDLADLLFDPVNEYL